MIWAEIIGGTRVGLRRVHDNQNVTAGAQIPS